MKGVLLFNVTIDEGLCRWGQFECGTYREALEIASRVVWQWGSRGMDVSRTYVTIAEGAQTERLPAEHVARRLADIIAIGA